MMRMSVLGLAAAGAVSAGSLVAEPARADVFVYRPGPVTPGVLRITRTPIAPPTIPMRMRREPTGCVLLRSAAACT